MRDERTPDFIGWIVTHKKMLPWTFGYTRKEAVERIVKESGCDWQDLRICGYRCKRVRAVEESQ